MRALLSEAKACRVCEKHLEPRPVVRASASARLLIVGQAPGRRVHESGIPWNDPSGDVLRGWLGMEREAFYDTARVAIVPMGLCYPGTVGGADLPPRRECAPAWHARLFAAMPQLELVLIVGSYAQRWHLGEAGAGSMTDTVRRWRELLPRLRREIRNLM